MAFAASRTVLVSSLCLALLAACEAHRPADRAKAPSSPSGAPVTLSAPPTAAPLASAAASSGTGSPEPLRARFLSVGDVMFARDVQTALDAARDPEHPFRPLADLYASVDFTFANLESPFFSGKPNRTPLGKHYAVLWARPEHVSTLAKYKFFAVNLANNHSMDQGVAGLDETLQALDSAGVRHVGAGATLDDAWAPMFVDVRGLRIAFVGASYTSRDDLGLPFRQHVARVEDTERLAQACKKAREGAHFVVATMHAGDEHKQIVNVQQRAFAKAAVRAGADVVIGAHPHVVQPAEKINGSWVFYSLGNFVFDQAAMNNSEALAVELRLTLAPGDKRAAIEKIVLHPVVIDRSAPAPAQGDRARRILHNVGASERELPP